MSQDDRFGTTADDGSKPEDDLYTAVSIEEDFDKLSNRRILDPSHDTHVINNEASIRWTREYDMAIEDLLTTPQCN
jgi:hypothetical protein